MGINIAAVADPEEFLPAHDDGGGNG